ncbi:MAG: ABC transporter ATP-binding protein [Pseudolabrys sp.]|nr:ABC transporter ATP-binding protein [Pseudolabrys sp.]
MIDLKNIGLTFARNGEQSEVLRGLDLFIPAGRFVAVLGPSGVGKSTLLRVIAGLLKPNTGSVALSTSPENAHLPVAMVFQDARLLPWRKVWANVAFGLEHSKLTTAERRAKAETALALVGLTGFSERFPHELSGGQRQRVALARALAVEPDILLMDEPFAALDAITREGLQDELARIHAATGKTIVFVTHSIDEAVHLADEVVVLAGKPARLAAAHVIDTPRPRRRNGDETAELVAQMRAQLGQTG